MQRKGGCPPTLEEASSKASVVELYRCKECGAETRYPRYNDPAKLLETRNVSRILVAASIKPTLELSAYDDGTVYVILRSWQCVAMRCLLRYGPLLCACLWQQQQQLSFGTPSTCLCCFFRDGICV